MFLWGRKVWLSCQSLQNHTLLITLLITLQYLQITHEKCACKCEKVWFFESHFYHTIKVWSRVWSHIYFCMGKIHWNSVICCGHKMFLNEIRNILFVSAANVAGKQGNICVGNNVSSFARTFKRLCIGLKSNMTRETRTRHWGQLFLLQNLLKFRLKCLFTQTLCNMTPPFAKRRQSCFA